MGNPASQDVPKAKVTTPRNFIDDCLKVHNEYRAKHTSPPIKLSEELCQIAQAWANRLSEIGKMEHSNMDYGENIYWSTNEPSARAAVEKWYSEIKDFNWGHLDWQKGTGHFTQVVWAESNELGVAKAGGKNGVYVVAIYNPQGNMMGDYVENVKPPK